jgi:DNA-binding transcriptional LysR family regulator
MDSGRISTAAKTLHLSQPAVTAQVRKLEEALGTALFLRSVRGVEPTEAALRLAVHARAIRQELDRAISELSGARTEPLFPLCIAASTTIAAHPLPPLLAQFRAQHRELRIELRVGNTEMVVEAVRAGSVSLGLVEGHTRASGLRLEPFLDDEIVPIVGRGAPFSLRRLQDLETVPILWREAGSGTRAVVARALHKAGVTRRKASRLDLELGNTEALMGAAAAGLGVAFVSRWSVRAHLAAGFVQLVPGLGLVIRRTFRWALPPGRVTGTAARFHAFANRSVLRD